MRVEVRGTGDLRRLSRDLRRTADGKVLRRRLVTNIRRALLPTAAAVRAAYRSGPSKHLRPPRLRRLLARATRVSVRDRGRSAGARIAVRGKLMPTGMGRLPKLYEGSASPWRHPVFNRDTWVTQRPQPTFYPTVTARSPAVRRAVHQIADQMADQIVRGR